MHEDDALDFERVLGEVSARFLSLPVDRIDEGVERALRLVCGLLETDRSFLLEFSPDLSTLTLTHLWARPGMSRQALPEALLSEHRWFAGELLAGRPIVHHELPLDVPEEAVEERAFVTAVGARASATVPIAVAGQNLCALGTTSFTRARTWMPRNVERLRLIGEVLASAIHRKRADAQLQVRLSEIYALQRRLAAENIYLREEITSAHDFQGIIGQSSALRDVLSRVAQVAPTSAPVLLLGETGTGKDLLARAIHDRSPRRPRPLVNVNCAAIPAALIESELFGHERGAFTGAVSQRLGRFEIAHGGTVFLDEIGDLDTGLQAKLLRVLQDGEFERLGSSRSIRTDVRVIAATNRDLSKALESGQFREDLYYRLSVVPIELPPLRHRREDIPLLLWEFINRRQAELGKRITKVRQADLQALQAYEWPGNIRELQNVVERALILSTGDTLRLKDSIPTGAGAAARSHEPLPPLAVVEREHILRALDRCGWIVEGRGHAAEVLGLHPNTLRFRMHKLGIHRPGSTPKAPDAESLLARK